MNYGFIMTRAMYPIKEEKVILGKYYFDNPRTSDEIKEVAKILKKINFVDQRPFPETNAQFGDEYINLEMIVDRFFDKYKLDSDFLKKKNGEEYKDIYYKMAKNWVILRFDNSNKKQNSDYELQSAKENSRIEIKEFDNFDNNYEEAIKYINLLTYICFPDVWYKNNRYLMTEFFDLYGFDEINMSVKNILLDLLIRAFSNQEIDDNNNFRFCSFEQFYDKMKKNEDLIISNMDNQVLNFIASNMNIYISLTDDKMRIITLVSMIELLLTHNPDANRFNVEDSIRKQFANKLTLILYLNDKGIKYNEIEKFLLMIYDIRSAIAHGSFDKIESVAKKINNWLKINDKEYNEMVKDEEFDIELVLVNINENLEKCFRIVLMEYLKDKNLFEILKK